MRTILSVKCHGATNMNYSKNVIRLAREITSHYARFNTIDNEYIIDINDVAEFDLYELAALMMSEDESLASEATGSDNPAYEKEMLPALTHFLTKSNDKDEQIEFMSAWKKGVTSYFKNTMTELFEEAVYQMNGNLAYNPDPDYARTFKHEYGVWL